jgi:hypothetical protein
MWIDIFQQRRSSHEDLTRNTLFPSIIATLLSFALTAFNTFLRLRQL